MIKSARKILCLRQERTKGVRPGVWIPAHLPIIHFFLLSLSLSIHFYLRTRKFSLFHKTPPLKVEFVYGIIRKNDQTKVDVQKGKRRLKLMFKKGEGD